MDILLVLEILRFISLPAHYGVIHALWKRKPYPYLLNLAGNSEKLSTNPYASTDPAPPASEENPEKLKNTLLDENLPLFKRYRAMFALRNKGDDTSILTLAEGLKSKNALFRHEIAYVLGQIQSPLVTNQLLDCLRDENEMDMVRNEFKLNPK